MRLNGNLYRILSMTEGEGSCTFCIELNPEHWIKECHFPGNPVVPGVFLLQMTTELLEEKMGYKLFINGIKNVKFINLMSPESNPEISIKLSGITPVEGMMKVQAVFSDSSDPGRLFAKMSLTLQDKRI